MSLKPSYKKLWASEWPHFKPEEVLSPDGLSLLSRGILAVQPHAMTRLEAYREALGRPMLVNHGTSRRRGYRSASENAAVGGEPMSFHLQGLAFDITVPGMSVSELATFAENFGWTGIGVYPSRGFVHHDVRPMIDIGSPSVIWHG